MGSRGSSWRPTGTLNGTTRRTTAQQNGGCSVSALGAHFFVLNGVNDKLRPDLDWVLSLYKTDAAVVLNAARLAL